MCAACEFCTLASRRRIGSNADVAARIIGLLNDCLALIRAPELYEFVVQAENQKRGRPLSNKLRMMVLSGQLKYE